MRNCQEGAHTDRTFLHVWQFRLVVFLAAIACLVATTASAAAITNEDAVAPQPSATTSEQESTPATTAPTSAPAEAEDSPAPATTATTPASPSTTVALAPLADGFGGFLVRVEVSGKGQEFLSGDVRFKVRVKYDLPGNATATDYPDWQAPGKLERDKRTGSVDIQVSTEEETDGPQFPDGTELSLEYVANTASQSPAETVWGAGKFEPGKFTVAENARQDVLYQAVLNHGNLPFTVAKHAGGVDGAADKEYSFRYTCNVNGTKYSQVMVVPGNGEPVTSPETFPAGTCCKVVELEPEAQIDGADLVTPKDQLTKSLIVGEKPTAPDVTFDNQYETSNRVKIAKRPFDRSGAQVTVVGDGTGEFTARYRLEFTNVRDKALLLTGEVFDELAYPAGSTITDVEFRAAENGPALTGIQVEPQVAQGEVVRRRSIIPGAAIGEIPAGATKTLFVTVRATVQRELLEHIGEHKCVGPDPNEAEASDPRGLQNSIFVDERVKDLDGPDNNHACVELALPKVNVEKNPRPAKAMQVRPNGTADLEYRIRVRSAEVRMGATVITLKDEPLLDVAEVTGDAQVTVAADAGVTMENQVHTVPAQRVAGVFTLAENIKLPAKTSVEFTIRIPVKVAAGREDTAVWKRLGECYRDENGEFVGGVRNRVHAPFDADGTQNNTACIPLQFPDRPTVRFSKVNFEGTPLHGAEFTIYPDYKGKPSCVPVHGAAPVPTDPADPNIATIALAPGTYYLVETKAPKSHSLLIRPVAFQIIPNADGTAYEIKLVSHDEYVASTDGLNLRVANTLAGTLPNSGGVGQAWQLILGLLVIGTGAHLMRRQTQSPKRI